MRRFLRITAVLLVLTIPLLSSLSQPAAAAECDKVSSLGIPTSLDPLLCNDDPSKIPESLRTLLLGDGKLNFFTYTASWGDMETFLSFGVKPSIGPVQAENTLTRTFSNFYALAFFNRGVSSGGKDTTEHVVAKLKAIVLAEVEAARAADPSLETKIIAAKSGGIDSAVKRAIISRVWPTLVLPVNAFTKVPAGCEKLGAGEKTIYGITASMVPMLCHRDPYRIDPILLQGTTSEDVIRAFRTRAEKNGELKVSISTVLIDILKQEKAQANVNAYKKKVYEEANAAADAANPPLSPLVKQRLFMKDGATGLPTFEKGCTGGLAENAKNGCFFSATHVDWAYLNTINLGWDVNKLKTVITPCPKVPYPDTILETLRCGINPEQIDPGILALAAPLLPADIQSQLRQGKSMQQALADLAPSTANKTAVVQEFSDKLRGGVYARFTASVSLNKPAALETIDDMVTQALAYKWPKDGPVCTGICGDTDESGGSTLFFSGLFNLIALIAKSLAVFGMLVWGGGNLVRAAVFGLWSADSGHYKKGVDNAKTALFLGAALYMVGIGLEQGWLTRTVGQTGNTLTKDLPTLAPLPEKR